MCTTWFATNIAASSIKDHLKKLDELKKKEPDDELLRNHIKHLKAAWKMVKKSSVKAA